MFLNSIQNTLSEREVRYGPFINGSIISQLLKYAMRGEPINGLPGAITRWKTLSADKRQALEAIADKIGRILNPEGDADYPDSWHDIAGYAVLVEQRIKTRNEST